MASQYPQRRIPVVMPAHAGDGPEVQHFLALTETWITPQNTATPAALSAGYTFSHTPRPSGRGGGTGPLGCFLDEMDALLSTFPEDGTPVLLLSDFNLPLETPQASAFLPLLQSLAESPSTHKAGNQLDLIFTRNGQHGSLHAWLTSPHGCPPTT
ncbi:hypothetical protein AAFF_G00249710 [Aldrovandia affinis]|uniref:Uncharacterized protein n=1 Tax=Aldrovandia affinis TaxID=143900 RepID=A0AAD7RDB5_9TELE|nr:hypothetical protein AAFF_G00249710 [Aldrovandia affinis]